MAKKRKRVNFCLRKINNMNLINGSTEVGKRLECGLAKVIISFFFFPFFNLLVCVCVRSNEFKFYIIFFSHPSPFFISLYPFNNYIFSDLCTMVVSFQIVYLTMAVTMTSLVGSNQD